MNMTRQELLEWIATILFILNLFITLLQALQNALTVESLGIVSVGASAKLGSHAIRRYGHDQKT